MSSSSSSSQLSPRTSPRSESPPTSLLQSEPPSSPLNPISSHLSEDENSTSSSNESPPLKRRKTYEFSELMVPQDPMFWPHGETRNDDERSRSQTESVVETSGIGETSKNGERSSNETDPGVEISDVDEIRNDDERSKSEAELAVQISVITETVDEDCDTGFTNNDSITNMDPEDKHPSLHEDHVVLSDLSDISSESEASDMEQDSDDNNFCDEKEQNERDSQSSSSQPESQNEDEQTEQDDDGEEREDSDLDSDSSISDVKIYPDNDMSISEGVLVLMDLFLKNKLTKTAMGEITVALQKFLPKGNYMPRTKHQLFKFITDRSPPVPVTTHYYCKECLFYLGKEEKNCTLCNNSSKKFYQLCLESQIRNLFEHHNLADLLDKYAEKRRSRSQSGYSDFCDGEEYKRAHRPGKYNLTFLGHSDGISISDSSEVSLWPLEWGVLEISHYDRFKYLIISGVWVDDSHPYMNCFLRPFVDELKELYVNGVKWTHPKTKNVETTYVVAPVFCGDGPVRADIQNILYHGGRHCCHVCEQKMALLDAEPIPPGETKPPRRRRAFQFLETPSRLRTAARMDAQGRMTLKSLQANPKAKPVKGVKGLSVISELPNCDRSTVVYPEYMHLLIGIVKLFMKLWFEGDAESPMSLKRHLNRINQFLKDVRVPDFVTRTPRSINCYSSWKANELRTFVLYLSLIIFSEVMTEEYLQHWMLFVSAMNIFLQETIPESDVTKGEIMIKMFLRDFPRLYGKKNFTYNLHELSHLAHVTRLWGPAYLNSAFWFEGFNGTLANYIHGTKEQGQELINTVQLVQGVQTLKARCNPQNNKSSKNVFEFMSEAHQYKLNSQQKQKLKKAGFVKPIYKYYRASRNGEDFTSSTYCRQEKRNNFTICFRNSARKHEYGEIALFVCNGDDNDASRKQMVLVNPFIIEHMRTFTHKASKYVVPHIIPVKESDDVILLPVEDILFKVVRVGDFVCLRPNKVEGNL